MSGNQEESRCGKLPIDGGPAWVVCFACMVLFGFVAGGFKSQGVILVELQERFPTFSPTSLLWVFSVSSLINRLSGPVNGWLLTKTSHRTVSLVGVALTSSTLVVLGYLPTPTYMYPVMAIGYGFGSGMLSLVSFTAYTQYFDKKKALALGITASGSGLGTIVLPPILRLLFDHFTFPAAMMLYGGVALQLFIPASLLRPMSFYQRIYSINSRRAVISEGNERSEDLSHQPDKKLSDLDTPAIKYEGNLQPVAADDITDDVTALAVGAGDRSTTTVLFSSANDLTGSALLFTSKQDLAAEEKIDKAKSSFNWKVSLKPSVILLGVAIFFYNAGTGVIYQCIPPLGKSAGVSKELIALLLTCAGVTEIPCRILNGFLADRKLVSAIAQLAVCMGITGLACLLCGLISGTAGIVIMLFAMSSFGTSVFSLLPIVIGDLVGQENVTSAMSFNFVYQALGSIAGTFCGGEIRGWTGRWEYVYIYCCVTILIASSINGAAATVRRCQTHRCLIQSTSGTAANQGSPTTG